LSTSLCAQRDGGRGRPQRESPRLENFTFEEVTFPSERVRRGEAGYGVYLPKGYADEANKDTRYPWIVWLHGFGGYGEFQDRGGAAVLDKLRGEGKIPPLVMVVFRSPAGRSVYLNGEAACDTEDLIVVDLVAHAQGKYRLADQPALRALMGVSMGGLGALKIAMKHPDVFGAVGAHSAAILPADPEQLPPEYKGMVDRQLRRGGLYKVLGDPIDKAKWAAEMPLGIVAARKVEDLKGLRIYFDAGTEDRYGFAEPNQELARAMTEKCIKHRFELIEGGGHAFGSSKMKENLASSLQFLAAVFAGKDPYAVEAAAKPAAVDGDKDVGAGK
jgi:enterochelin esterase-like enzyme